MHLLCLISNKINNVCPIFFSLFIHSRRKKKVSTKTQKSARKIYSPKCNKIYWLIDVCFGNFNHFWATSTFLAPWKTKKIKFSKDEKAKSLENLILHCYTTSYNHWVLGMRVVTKYSKFYILWS